MSDRIRLSVTTLNAPDALTLATFYAELTGGVTQGSAHWAAVSGPNGSIAFQQVDEVAFALPFSFEHEDYVQILTDIATLLGPALGWRPSG